MILIPIKTSVPFSTSPVSKPILDTLPDTVPNSSKPPPVNTSANLSIISKTDSLFSGVSSPRRVQNCSLQKMFDEKSILFLLNEAPTPQLI